MSYAKYSGLGGGSGGGGGVTSLNGETGAVTLVAGSGITVTPAGQNITIAASGSGGTPGGTSGQVQFNNSGAFGGFGSWNGTTLAITGAISSTTTMAVGTNLHVFGTSIMAGDMVVQGGANFSGNLGFYGVGEISQPSGNIFTALTNLGLVASPSLPASQLTGLGDLTDTGTDGIVVTGGTGAIIGSGVSLAQHVADSTHNGYLSSTDWSTFNGKQAAGNYISALTGDVSASGPGSVAAVLATVNSNTGSFGSSTAIPSFTVNGKGLITAASSSVVIAPAGTLTGTTLNSTVVSSSLTSVGTQSQALNMGTHQINGVVDPTLAQDAATKNYVDTVASGLQPIQAVSAATTGSNISGTYLNGASGIGATFTTTSTATFTVDGYTPTLNQRILFKDQTSGFQNGVYNITQLATGVLPAIFTRALDYNTASDIDAGNLIPVVNGTINAQTSWLQTANVTTVGTDSLVFVKWTANPANYLLKTNNLSDVSSAPTSFNNISPMTTAGDIIYENATPAAARLPIGTSGQFLVVTSGLPAWSSVTPGSPRDEVCVTVGNGSGSTNTFVRKWTNSTNGVNGAVNTGTAITYVPDTGSGLGDSFTINIDGLYAISYDESISTSDQFGVTINQITGTQAYTQVSLAEQIVGSSQQSGCCSATLFLASGSVIRGLWGADGEGNSSFQKFRITRVN